MLSFPPPHAKAWPPAREQPLGPLPQPRCEQHFLPQRLSAGWGAGTCSCTQGFPPFAAAPGLEGPRCTGGGGRLRARREPTPASAGQGPTALCSCEPSVLPSRLARRQLGPRSRNQRESTEFPPAPAGAEPSPCREASRRLVPSHRRSLSSITLSFVPTCDTTSSGGLATSSTKDKPAREIFWRGPGSTSLQQKRSPRPRQHARARGEAARCTKPGAGGEEAPAPLTGKQAPANKTARQQAPGETGFFKSPAYTPLTRHPLPPESI